MKTGECYVGSSVNIQRRVVDHMTYLADGVHINKLLQHSWNDSGLECFVFSILEVVLDKERLGDREIYWVKKTGALEQGFNTKSDQHERSAVVVVDMGTKRQLEELEMGSMQSALSQLLKYYKKYSEK